MVSKDVCVILRKLPYSTSMVFDAISLSQVFSVFNQKSSVIFLDDGLYQLIDNQEPSNILQKKISLNIESLDLYDMDKVIVCLEDLNDRKLNKSDLCINAEIMDRQAIAIWINNQDIVLTF